MNVRLPSISFIDPQTCFRYPILYCKRNQEDTETQQQKTLRIFNLQREQQQQQHQFQQCQCEQCQHKFFEQQRQQWEREREQQPSSLHSSTKPSTTLKFTSARNLHKRTSPYERPIENELKTKKETEEKEKENTQPIRVSKTFTTSIEINRPISYLERSLVEKALTAVSEPLNDPDTVMIDIKKEEETTKKDNKQP